MKQDTEQTITYQEFMSLPAGQEIPPGLIVTNIKPAELKTTQDWFSATKAARASSAFVDNKCTDPVEVRVVTTANQRALVLGDGTHRSAIALFGDLQIDGKISDKPVEQGQQVFDLRKVAMPYADILVIDGASPIAFSRGRSRVIKETRTRPVTPERRHSIPGFQPSSYSFTTRDFRSWDRIVAAGINKTIGGKD